MRRPLAFGAFVAALLLAQATTPAAWASDSAVGRMEMTWRVPSSVGSFGVFTSVDRSVEATGVGERSTEASIAGLSWQAGGLVVSAGAGLFAYRYVGAGDGAGRVATFALSHHVLTTGGGSLAVELRQSWLWEGETRSDVVSARLGWSLKF